MGFSHHQQLPLWAFMQPHILSADTTFKLKHVPTEYVVAVFMSSDVGRFLGLLGPVVLPLDPFP